MDRVCVRSWKSGHTCEQARFGCSTRRHPSPKERGPSLRQAPGLNVAALFQGTRDIRRLKSVNSDPQSKKLPVTALGPEFPGHRDDQFIAIKKEARRSLEQRASIGSLGGATACKFAFCA
ncbi:hypothetical protein AGR6A_Cc120146 [Agrobacterium sp. NCPPB 925]|nr:hypothetical protein AGR6A_Cc120146 [Agrobacterium sp. NCPPB 925]